MMWIYGFFLQFSIASYRAVLYIYSILDFARFDRNELPNDGEVCMCIYMYVYRVRHKKQPLRKLKFLEKD